MKSQSMMLISLLIFFGAINTILLKLQNIQVIGTIDNKQAHFFHPFMQTLCMFIGQSLVGMVYAVRRRRALLDESEGNGKPKASIAMVLIPTIFDLFSTLLSYIALNMVASSVWQISRGGNIITTALLSRAFLNRRFTNSAIIGCVLAFVGITCVQVVTVIASDKNQDGNTTQQIIGIILLFISLLFNSCGMVTQKWIFNKYEMSPLKMVFLEGVYGIVFMLPLTFAFQFISCPWDSHSECVKVGDEYFLENIANYFNELSNSLLLMLFNIGLVFSIAISVPIAVTVSKKISPVSRSLADVCRTSLIWAFGITMTLTIGRQNSQYQMEDTDILVNILKGVGFIILIVGTLMYHDLIPCFAAKPSSPLLIASIISADDNYKPINPKSQTLM